MILIVASTRDVASINIRDQIASHQNLKETGEAFQENPILEAKINEKDIKLITLNQDLTTAESVPSFFPDAELIVFISRHSSASRIPTLSVHTSGILGGAEDRGAQGTVSVAPANAMKTALKSMIDVKSEGPREYVVTYECTHHGPSLEVPSLFAELGSSSEQWKDAEAGVVVANAVIESVSAFGDSSSVAVLGIGGPHYNSKFTKLAMTSQIAFGHIIPKYSIPYISSQIISHCVERTLEEVDRVVLDWKGIRGEDKRTLVEMIDELGLQYERV